MKNLSLRCAVLIASLSGPALARAESIPDNGLQEQIQAGTVRRGKPNEDPCAENKQLEGKRYRFQLTPAGQDKPLMINFSYAGECTVSDRDWDGDPVTPSASRRFKGDAGNYELYINTELGSDASELLIIQTQGGAGFLISANLDSKPTRDLLDGTVKLGAVSLTDWKAAQRGKEMRGDATLEIVTPR